MQKKLIVFIIFLFITSSSYLLFLGNRYANTDYEKSWWAIYFSDPKSNDLDFTIENQEVNFQFHYEIYEGKNKIKEGDLTIKKGNKEEIKVDSLNNIDSKVTIVVSSGEEKKEIYKNF